MKINLFLVAMCMLISFGTISCKKYLDKKRDESLSTPTTLTDLRALLDKDGDLNQSITPSLGEVSSDNYYLRKVDYDAIAFEEAKSAYRWDIIPYIYSNDWARSYSAVYISNLVLESLEKIPMTSENETEWKSIKGTALFFRGYSFLNLAWVYAKAYDSSTANVDLGIDLRLESDFNIPSVRSSVQDTYNQILADLNAAVSYLPLNTSQTFRPTRLAAYGALARTYLSMRDYNAAYEKANSILTVKSDLLDYGSISNSTDTASTSATNSFLSSWSGPEVIFQSTMTTLLSYGAMAPTRARIDSVLYASYHKDDMRKYLYFARFSPPTTQPYQYKFKGTYMNGNANAIFSGIAVDEIYLIRAECSARKGDLSAALSDLNVLMKKRWRNSVPYPTITASTASEALEKILIERRKELIYRGLRWMDIKRLNKEGRNIIQTRILDGVTYTLAPNALYYALPLPKDIIDITGIPQNPR